MRKARWFGYACALLCASLLLLSCHISLQSAENMPPPAPSRIVSATAIMRAPLPQILTSGLPPTLLIEPAPEVRAAQLLTAKHGWLLTKQALWWTDDNGDHWRTITPMFVPASTIAQVTFIDIAHGWLVVAAQLDTTPGHAEIRVLQTQNGGQSWQSFRAATYTDCFSCTSLTHSLFFLNPEEGWLVINRTETMSSAPAELFHTEDGGRTWHQLPAPPRFGAVRFITPQVGWFFDSCCAAFSYKLWQTHDGGNSWEALTLHDLRPYWAIGLPAFADDSHGLLAVNLIDRQGSSTGQIAFYQTDDAGKNWIHTATFSVPSLVGQQIDEGLLTGNIVTRSTWMLTVNQQLYLTADAGRTWQVKALVEHSGGFTALQLFPDRSGWALLLKDNCASACTVPMRTSDNGQTWQLLPLPTEHTP